MSRGVRKKKKEVESFVRNLTCGFHMLELSFCEEVLSQFSTQTNYKAS